MKPRAWILGSGMLASIALIALCGFPAAARGEDAAPPLENTLPGVLRFGITSSQIDMRTLTRDDLRPVPSPRIDGISDQVRITVTEGDPSCLPLRPTWAGPASATGGMPGVGLPR